MKENPFEVVKSVDFSDNEIDCYWVDLGNDINDGFSNIVKPKSPVPMILLGGKGSGKTHIVRYLSYRLQRIRHEKDVLGGIRKEGYLGIYFSLGGLNEGRFKGKRVPSDQWTTALIQYLDLSIASQTIATIKDFVQDSGKSDLINERHFCLEVSKLFQVSPAIEIENMEDLIRFIDDNRDKIDYAVNNSAFSRSLDIEVISTRGSLVLEIPELFSSCNEIAEKPIVLYIFDEIENVDIEVQKYLQTLIRECRKNSSSIKICGRLYGLKTKETFCDGERNVEGSEFETLILDEHLRQSDGYNSFAERLCFNRLKNTGSQIVEIGDLQQHFCLSDAPQDIQISISEDDKSRYALNETWFLLGDNSGKERRYTRKLRSKLAQIKLDESTIDQIESLVSIPQFPLIEKTCIALFYKGWYQASRKRGRMTSQALIGIAESVSRQAQSFIQGNQKSNEVTKYLSHFRSDLLAQIRREHGKKVNYLGLSSFIAMSCGLPRNLLQILKYTYASAQFRGEDPFSKFSTLSVEAQRDGVRQASKWFFEDALIGRGSSMLLQDSISRVAEIFSEVRFADKPAECSVLSFSCDETAISHGAREKISSAIERSLLIRVYSGRRDKNSRSVNSHLQLNPMLSPHWDLPIYRRGSLSFSPDLVNSIFDEECREEYNQYKSERLKGMNAPFVSTKHYADIHPELEL